MNTDSIMQGVGKMFFVETIPKRLRSANRLTGQRAPRSCWVCVIATTIGLLSVSGCEKKSPSAGKEETSPYHVVHPTERKIVRYVGQPSFIEAFERTSIFPKVTGYIEKWNVDIGDKVKKDDVLATLYVPELVEDYGTKKATVELDRQKVDLAKVFVDVCQSDVEAAEAKLAEAKSILEKYQSDVDRWQSEVDRLAREVRKGDVDPQVLLESRNQLKQSAAARTASSAAIENAKAELHSRQNVLRKAKVDVGVTLADLAVAESEEKRLKAWVGYLSLTSPFDGVIEARNANTMDFVSPSAGDPTAMQRAPHISPQHTAPIYVVDRTDIVRVFVDIPEYDANYVNIGTKASVLAKGYRNKEIPATVTRTSWALNAKSRTLRAEVDLPNVDSQILPGMYAYTVVTIERPSVQALPVDTVFEDEDRTYCWLYQDGKAELNEIRTGVSDGKWIEVNERRSAKNTDRRLDRSQWLSFDGKEQVIVGDLDSLSEGMSIEISNTSYTPDQSKAEMEMRPGKEKFASAAPKSLGPRDRQQ